MRPGVPIRLARSGVKTAVMSNYRFFSADIRRMNKEQPKEETPKEKPQKEEPSSKKEAEIQPKKHHKPLSRMPIGTETDYSKMTIKKSPIEYLTWKSIVLFVAVGAGLTWLFNNQKEKIKLRNEAAANRGAGKPLIGGPFDLVDMNGKKYTDEDLKGHFSLIYFGFTHCPHICPDELDDMGEIIDGLKEKYKLEFQPLFITCDPVRDSPEMMKEYLGDFHPKILGLTGTYDDVKKCCKAYRVYFSTPRNVKPGQDYLVDHSIFYYLMDPEGKFIDVLGRNYDVKTAIEKIKDDMKAYVPENEREKAKKGLFGFLYK